jgi:hypothetical protein
MYIPLKGQLYIAPDMPVTSSLLIDPTPPKVEATMTGLILALGAGIDDPDLSVGATILFTPHAGAAVPVPEGHPVRMTIPLSSVIGIVEPQ